ncbi:Tyrosine recombinase XerD [subsurface metagenome]
MTATPKTLNVTECHQLLATLKVETGTKNKIRKGIRNHTIALLMLDAGLRVGEVVQLHVSDLFFHDKTVENLVVRAEIAKNKTERIVPLSSRLGKAVSDLNEKLWKPNHRANNAYAMSLCMGTHSITTRQVERIIRAAAMKSIGRPVHPHMLRHTFGTRIERKAGLRVAQELLGHENVSSTQIYTHVNSDDLKKAIREACGDEQERHLMTTDSSLDSRCPD